MSWQIDFAHSHIYFTARHMMISKVRGNFESFSGDIAFDPDNPAATTVNVAIDAATITTGMPDRDNHLRSADFLDVENYPTITFVGTDVTQSDAHSGQLTGDLTIGDVTREVTLDVSYSGVVANPFTGAKAAGFTATTKINREDFGLTWNVALESGGWLVGKQINIEIELELIKVTEQVPA